jgi:hypothetical protein
LYTYALSLDVANNQGLLQEKNKKELYIIHLEEAGQDVRTAMETDL